MDILCIKPLKAFIKPIVNYCKHYLVVNIGRILQPDKAVVGVDLEASILVALAEAVDNSLHTSIRAYGLHLFNIFSHLMNVQLILTHSEVE